MIVFEKKGLLTTVQDLGRTGYQRFGMPTAGAMDPFAMQLANILVGNDPGEAVIEVTIAGPVITFEEPEVFAICGGDFGARLDGAPICNNRAWAARAGARLELSAARQGARAYIAFAGGLDVKPVMGSRSTCVKAVIGGIKGRPLQDGDKVALRAARDKLDRMEERTVPEGFGPGYKSMPIIRFTYGPQEDMFTDRGKNTFSEGSYILSPKSDRMGFRFDGPEIEKVPDSSGNIISDGVCFGSIQVTNGQPIVMMADHQTVGGYPKLGCVITADLPLLAQLKAGDAVHFLPVDIASAQQAYLSQMELLNQLAQRLSAPPAVAEQFYRVKVCGKTYQVSICTTQ